MVITPELTAQLVELHAKGMSAADAARQVGLSKSTATRAMHKAGLNIVAKSRPMTAEIAQEICLLYSMDLGVYAIAKRVGSSPRTCHRILLKCGIKTRARGMKGTKCVDCGKPTFGGKRCKWHSKVRKADMNRNVVRERNGIKPKNYRIFYDEPEQRDYFGPTIVEWRTKQSGLYGPLVRQAIHRRTK